MHRCHSLCDCVSVWCTVVEDTHCPLYQRRIQAKLSGLISNITSIFMCPLWFMTKASLPWKWEKIQTRKLSFIYENFAIFYSLERKCSFNADNLLFSNYSTVTQRKLSSEHLLVCWNPYFFYIINILGENTFKTNVCNVYKLDEEVPLWGYMCRIVNNNKLSVLHLLHYMVCMHIYKNKKRSG